MKCARFSPDGKWLATGSADGFVRIWDASTFQPAGPPIKRSGAVLCVRFSPDSSRLVVGGEDAQAAVYDTATWKQVGVPVLAPGAVFSAVITQDNRFLVIAAFLLDAVQFFEISSGRSLGQGLPLPSQATCVDYLLQDKVVVVACDDGTVRAVDSPFVDEDVPPWMCAFAERLAGLKKTGPEQFERHKCQLEQLQAGQPADVDTAKAENSRLAHRKLAAGSQRTGMPRFISTLAANVERRVEERSIDALFDCYEADPGDMLTLGALSLYLPNSRQSEFIADLVLRVEKADPLARCFAAGALVNAGRSAEAEAVMARALQDAPDDLRVLRRCAKLHARLLDKQVALELFEKALRLDPHDF